MSYVMMIVLTALLMTYFSNLADVTYLRDEDKIKITDMQELVLEGTNLYNRVMREFNNLEMQDVEIFRDPDTMTALNQIILKENIGKNSGVILRINEEIVYVSNVIDSQEMFRVLPDFGAKFSYLHKLDFNGESDYVINAQYDFYFNNGDKGTFFIATYIVPLIEKTDIFNIIFRRLGIAALIISGFFIALSIYKEVQKSLTELTHASELIKEGVYDNEIKHKPHNELGDLIEVFEQMRVKLSNSLIMQKKYEKDRKYMVSSMSHDLKTPIMSIKGYIQGLKDGVADTPEKNEKYMNIIYREAESLETMINELFLYSKLDLKQEVFFFKDMDIVNYFRFFIEDLEFELKKNNGKINLHTKEDKLIVSADIQKLNRVVMNIISNSVKYASKENPQVDVYLSKVAHYVQVEIHDNGMGIPKDQLPNIFSRFYRVDKSRNTAVKGSGIGLAIAKQIIESHKGEIWASSKNDDGTIIGFRLPVIEE